MRLKAHNFYLYTPPHPTLGKPRRVIFLAWAGKNFCKIVDGEGTGPVYKRVARFRLSELSPSPAAPVQTELFS